MLINLFTCLGKFLLLNKRTQSNGQSFLNLSSKFSSFYGLIRDSNQKQYEFKSILRILEYYHLSQFVYDQWLLLSNTPSSVISWKWLEYLPSTSNYRDKSGGNSMWDNKNVKGLVNLGTTIGAYNNQYMKKMKDEWETLF